MLGENESKTGGKDGEPSAPRAPGETALDLEALALFLEDRSMTLNCGLLGDKAQEIRARLRSTPGAQESRPLTWTREKPTAPGLYRVRKHKFLSSAEVWTHPSFGRSFDMNCEDLSPHDPEIEWCGPYPEPQTLSEGGATA